MTEPLSNHSTVASTPSAHRPLRIVFAGTPGFALPCLKSLLDSSHSIVAVYTQPDRPAGRGRQLLASPVKEFALTQAVPVKQPVLLTTPAAIAELTALEPDLLVVVAYGLLLPPAALAVPRYGCINVHASLLPRWRGAAPIQRAIAAGDTMTGVTIMQMNAGLDTGDSLLQLACPITDQTTSSTLHDELAHLGANALMQTLTQLLAGQLQPQPQDSSLATYAAKLSKADALVDWSRSALVIDRQIRALEPWPVAVTRFATEMVKLWQAIRVDQTSHLAPGSLVAIHKTAIDIACGEGVLRILSLQRPNRQRITAADFIHAEQARLVIGQPIFY